MQYMGGKFRIAKHILPIILKDRQEGQWYVEPFCGGCNTLSEVTGNRIGADSHYYLIALWQAVSLCWLPPESVTEDEYNYLKQWKNYKTYDNVAPLMGYVGFACSFGAKWFRGFDRPGRVMPCGRINNKPSQSYKSALKQFPKLRDVIFKHCSYEDLKIPEKSIIYCDPPYEGTTGYNKEKFNHIQFWEQCHNWVFDGHRVFVSEYNAPSDWVCVWSKEQLNCISQGKHIPTIEKLFIHRSQYNG